MSEMGTNKEASLNWRGPLLAAFIFAAAFGVLLLMAHQNESNTADMGSSMREDPYGTSLLFDSYARAGYQVKRSQDADSLSDQDASKTTAFFVGQIALGFGTGDAGDSRSAEKFRARIEEFLSQGGRVVLAGFNGDLKSASQGWEVQNTWDDWDQKKEPFWISADSSAMPLGSEQLYLKANAPWLKTGPDWTVLYAVPANDQANSPRVYMAKRKVGNGEIIAISQEGFALNEVTKNHPSPVLLDFLTGGRPVVWVDETLHGLEQQKGVLWLVQRYRLQIALMIFWIALLALLWSMSGDLVRRAARDQNTQIIRLGEAPGVAGRRLMQRSIAPELVVAECWDQFRRRSPQDAQAISGDPRYGPALRAALGMAPLAGYRELQRLITERRTSLKTISAPTANAGSTKISQKRP